MPDTIGRYQVRIHGEYACFTRPEGGVDDRERLVALNVTDFRKAQHAQTTIRDQTLQQIGADVIRCHLFEDLSRYTILLSSYLKSITYPIIPSTSGQFGLLRHLDDLERTKFLAPPDRSWPSKILTTRSKTSTGLKIL